MGRKEGKKTSNDDDDDDDLHRLLEREHEHEVWIGGRKMKAEQCGREGGESEDGSGEDGRVQ